MKVQPRALAALLQKPVAQRLPIIAEGLTLVVEHVGELRRSVATLQSVGQLRAAAILDIVAGEEAAKALILLDLVRVGWADQVVTSRQIKSFSSHLARGIYAEVSMMNPGSFRDVREMVARHRPSQYLDGPNDVDWVYRNTIESKREETLYVDYVQYEDEHRWVSPAETITSPYSAWTEASKLVHAMERSGLLSLRGLELTAEAWRGAQIADSMSWPEVAGRSVGILRVLGAEGAHNPAFSAEDAELIRERWTFPMHGLDLSRLQVTEEELRKERDDAFARLANDWL